MPPGQGHKISASLLKGMTVERSSQVWAGGHLLPKWPRVTSIWAVIDRHSRRVLAWRPSNTLASVFCVEAWRRSWAGTACRRKGFNTDQGGPFTSAAFTGVLKDQGVAIRMDGKGLWLANVFVKRLWRSVKYRDIHLIAYDTPAPSRGNGPKRPRARCTSAPALLTAA